MEIGIIIGLAVVGFGLGIGLLMVLNKLKSLENKGQDNQSFQMLNQNIQGMQQRIDETNKSINDRLDNAGRVIAQVSRELGTMSQIGSQLAHFQDFLKSPKLRGNLGEQGLKDLLSQALPAENVRFQFRFTTGEIVDAAIKLDAGIIPIDSKFPLENFNRYLKESDEKTKNSFANAFRRDFRNRVTEISKKYILPDQGTVDFAIMYLPSETVYYELVTSDKLRDLYDYAAGEKVIVASPATFFYYLRTLMVGLEGQRINQMAGQILKALRAIQQESNKFGDNVRVLGKHVTNAKNTMDQVQNDYVSLAGKIERVTMIESAETEQLTGSTKTEREAILQS